MSVGSLSHCFTRLTSSSLLVQPPLSSPDVCVVSVGCRAPYSSWREFVEGVVWGETWKRLCGRCYDDLGLRCCGMLGLVELCNSWLSPPLLPLRLRWTVSGRAPSAADDGLIPAAWSAICGRFYELYNLFRFNVIFILWT